MVIISLPTLPTIVVLFIGFLNFALSGTNMVIALLVYFPIPLCYAIGAYKNHDAYRQQNDGEVS